jgi:hypothetical protein
MNNSNVKISDLTEELSATCSRQRLDHVLLIQDTSQYNYERVRGRFAEDDPDIGVLGDNQSLGLFVHPTLGLDEQSGLPFGIPALKIYHLEKERALKDERNYTRLPIAEKHSHRWIESIKISAAALPGVNKMTAMADREGDMYELFASDFDPRIELLIRSAQNRKLTNGLLLHAHMDEQAWEGTYEVSIKGNKKRAKRMATLQIRWATVEIVQPRSVRAGIDNYPKSISMQVVEVLEVGDKELAEGEEPIHWYLYTTHPVETLEDALQIVNWYKKRWWIEDFFRLTKSQGFELEKSQFSNGMALKRLICLVYGEALRVLSLRQGREEMTEGTAAIVFDKTEMKLLKALLPGLQGRTHSQANLNPASSLAWAVWILARLGGWRPRNMNVRPPGVITLIRGLKNFNQNAQGYRLAMKLQNNIPT